MTEGVIWKSILLFSLPLIAGNLMQQLYNTADSLIVGIFSDSEAVVEKNNINKDLGNRSYYFPFRSREIRSVSPRLYSPSHRAFL